MTKEDLINKVLQEWAAEFLSDLERSAATKLPKDTGSGAQSFDTSILRAGASTAAQVIVSFQSYLRYFDMSNKNLRRDKDLPPDSLEQIKEWVERNMDKLLPGYKGPTEYKHKPGNIPTKTIINNIAWGISKKRTRIKRKQWYTKLKASRQYALYFQLLDELLPVMLTEVRNRVINN